MVVFQWIRQSGQTSQISLTVKTCGSLIYNQDQKEKSVRWVSGAKPRVYINNKKTQTIFYVVRSSLLKPWSKLTVCQVNLQPRFQSVMVHLALAPKTYAHALSHMQFHTVHCTAATHTFLQRFCTWSLCKAPGILTTGQKLLVQTCRW